MNRDNLLYGLMGVVIGMVLAYPLFESMSTRQPALRPPGQADASGQPGAMGVPNAGMPGAAPGAGPAAGAPAGGPAVERVRQLQARIRENPEDADAVLELARLNFQINDRVRARDLLEQYHGLRPDDYDALLTLANVSFDTGEFAKAREFYESYFEARPATPDILTDLGVAYRNLQQPEKALELFDRAQEMQPGHWVSLYNEVVVLAFDLGRFEPAAERLEELRRLQPGNQDVERLAEELERQRSAA